MMKILITGAGIAGLTLAYWLKRYGMTPTIIERASTLPIGGYKSVFTLPNYLNLDRVEVQYSELGRIACVWSSHGEPHMKACFGFNAPAQQVDLSQKSQQQQLLRTVFEDIGWEVPRFLEMMPEALDFYFDSCALVVMDHFSKGRVVLVGDAGYCASPMSGQGASLALIGAYVLAGELVAAKGNYKAAFERYESKLRPFAKRNQEIGIKGAQLMRSHEKNTLWKRLFKSCLKLAPAKVTGWLVKCVHNRASRRIQGAANSITLNEYVNCINHLS